MFCRRGCVACFTHRGGIFFGTYLPLGGGTKTTVIPYFFCAPPAVGEKRTNTAESMLYIPWFGIVRGQKVKKISFGNFVF